MAAEDWLIVEDRVTVDDPETAKVLLSVENRVAAEDQMIVEDRVIV